MAEINVFKRFFGHLHTINAHKRQVFRNCKMAGIPYRGLIHDMSKYSPVEFFSGVKYYTDGKKSPNEGERKKYGYSRAWLHHKGRNKHHFEYWNDYNPIERRVRPVKMPFKYVVEMFCDRVAASKIYQGVNYTDSHPYEYFARGKEGRFIHDKTSQTVEAFLIMLKNKGECDTFSYIKNNFKMIETLYNNNDFPNNNTTLS